MNPLVLLIPLAGLGLFALARTAQAQSETKPAEKPKAKDTTQDDARKRRYAQLLLSYVNKGRSNSRTIKYYQRKIGAKATGKADTQTERKIESILGYNVSWKPKKKVVKPKVYTRKVARVKKAPAVKTTTPAREPGPLEELLATLTRGKAPTKVAKPAPVKAAPARIAKKPQPKKPKLLPATTETRAPRFTSIPTAVPDSVIAATALDSYLRSGGLARARVKEYQRRMGSLAIDGIPGPKTKARAETLLHRSISWPAQNAADDLRTYYRGGGRDRTKIKAFQNAMGELTVDGLVGPKTKRRYKALTGKTF